MQWGSMSEEIPAFFWPQTPHTPKTADYFTDSVVPQLRFRINPFSPHLSWPNFPIIPNFQTPMMSKQFPNPFPSHFKFQNFPPIFFFDPSISPIFSSHWNLHRVSPAGDPQDGQRTGRRPRRWRLAGLDGAECHGARCAGEECAAKGAGVHLQVGSDSAKTFMLAFCRSYDVPFN